jgi:hypothetical protein
VQLAHDDHVEAVAVWVAVRNGAVAFAVTAVIRADCLDHWCCCGIDVLSVSHERKQVRREGQLYLTGGLLVHQQQ